MTEQLPMRFWIETALAAASSILLLVTLARRNWIETLFGVDPDTGNGALEWMITGTLLVITVALVYSARRQYRESRLAGTNA
ncbi:MAG: hypothetical protein PVSMB7_27060 [Chloroflexota bacterium]